MQARRTTTVAAVALFVAGSTLAQTQGTYSPPPRTDLTRADALRQTMLALMDGAGQRNASGKLQFSYAHPMFWAPFSLVGDGGR